MRKAGFWVIDLKGVAKFPIYIEINNQAVNFKDATHLWGMETAKAQWVMEGGILEKKAVTVSIGPDGE
jgi:aldehyde:ferredoxin oxidoreductase